MVGLDTIRASNGALKKLNSGLVAVFVGGTSGIGEYTLKAFVQHTASPRVYIVGRSEDAAKRIVEEAKQLNAESNISFIKSPDLSLLRNVDRACRELQEKEERINLLFMTPGFLTLKGRDETTEGLDKKMTLNYYARMRFATNLLPQLDAAAAVPSLSAADSLFSKVGLSRVVSVLSAGREGALIADDLSLRTHYSLRNCEAHSITMTDLVFEELAARHPRTSYVHAFPGAVDTNIVSRMGTPFSLALPVIRPLMGLLPMHVSPAESGERHLYAATAEAFAPREVSKGRDDVAVGSDGEKGSGAYLINHKTDRTGQDKVLSDMRAKGMREKVWQHNTEVFESIGDSAGPA